MDTTKNRVQYGMLEPEEKALFCLEALKRGMYEWHEGVWQSANYCGGFDKLQAYRLKILPEEWYYVEAEQYPALGLPLAEIITGADIVKFKGYYDLCLVRPATPEEIPKPKVWEGEQLVGVWCRRSDISEDHTKENAPSGIIADYNVEDGSPYKGQINGWKYAHPFNAENLEIIEDNGRKYLVDKTIWKGE